MPQAHGVALPPLLATSLRAASILLPIILLPEAAVSQEKVTCPGLPPNLIILKNQPYALCAGAKSVNFNEITYANCSMLHGNSISLPQHFPFPPVNDHPGDINTVNQGAPNRGGYIVSTYSPPVGATKPDGNLAVYQCEGGTYAQCDGGLCSTSTTGKTSPLWGHVSNRQIICSCPIATHSTGFEVMGPKPCPTTAAEFDSVCGSNVSGANNGTTIYIGSPVPGSFESLAACLGQPVTLNHCTRPAR
jgi:hypothetical protein